MKITPIMYQILQSRLNIFPNKKSSVQYMSKTCKMLPKWLNFAKSGLTGRYSDCLCLT